MNLGYLECDINSSEVFSEGRIIRLVLQNCIFVLFILTLNIEFNRLLALFVSSIWTKVAEMDDEQKTRIAFEIKEMSLDRLISNMDFKNAHRRVEFSERWSCMFTIFDHMNRAQRQEWIPRLLKKKQINKLSKAAYRLVSGDHFPIDIQFDNIVVKRAFHFLISTVFDLQLDESFNLSQLINWPCLIRLYAVDLRLVETIASKVPAEKVVEFLSSFTYDAGNSDLDAALCVASTVITPRLSRYSSELLGPFASIFEKCCSCTSILKFAANIVKNGSIDERERLVYGTTKLIHQLSRHSTYYNRLIAPIISEIIMESKHTQMAMFKLHTMNDKHRTLQNLIRFSSAMLATNLPAAEKRQYSRVFPEMKKALKPVV
uniref:NopRA1 domain-containing protein n=1 Tax=Heterorhabditis bacteriophora TaxID=37862 RepID=A0A1I7X6V4_HETBA